MGLIPNIQSWIPSIDEENFRYDREISNKGIEEAVRTAETVIDNRKLKKYGWATGLWIGTDGNKALSFGNMLYALGRGDFYENITSNGQKIYIDPLLLKKKYKVN